MTETEERERNEGTTEAKPSEAEVQESAGLVLASEILPEHIPILPMRPRPIFPGIPVPIEVRGEQVALIKQAVQSSAETLGLVLVRDPKAQDSPQNLHRVGVAAKILKALQTDSETAHVLVNCLERFTIENLTETAAGLIASVKYHYSTEFSVNDELKAYALAVISSLEDLVKLSPLQSEAIKLFLSHSTLDDPGRLADFAANLTTADGQELQDILEIFDVRHRIDKVLVLLKKEVEISKLQGEISRQIQEKISGHQREFFLKEQLKAIKKELGLEKEGKTTEIEKFQERLKERKLNAEAQKTVDEEMEKFQLVEPMSPEYTVTRNYLDWLTVLPWGVYSKESYDVNHARRILNRDHFGLDDVKERILEFIAVGKLKGGVSGSILCLAGPPGATLQIEATAVPSRSKGFKQTGQLGNVMLESADIAYSYVMAHLKKYGAKSDFFDKHFVHLHVPAGATPKDGPSAGVTMASALISMITGKQVREGLAMTGELTLTGHVLPIGGVKEKVIAARRAGLKVLIFPDANQKDFEELPDYLKKGLKVHFARRYEDVYKAAFTR